MLTENVISVCIVPYFYEQGDHYVQISSSRELAAPRAMRQAQTFDFDSKHVEKPSKSYQGIHVEVKSLAFLFQLASFLFQLASFLAGKAWAGN